jgi:hypothetical protein
MEKQKLPNATTSLILGILSFIACCCSMGIGGVILSGIALFLANKDRKTYAENPELYENYKQVNTARTVAIVGLALAIISLIYGIIQIVFFGGLEAYDVFMEEYQKQLELQS